MNPGAIEEAGTTARSLIDSMKHQPALLALIIFNVLYIALIYFGVSEQRVRQHEILQQLITNAEKAQEMLFKCITPQRQSRTLNDEAPHKALNDEAPHKSLE